MITLPSPGEIAAALIAREELPPERGEQGPQGKAGLDGETGGFGPAGPQGAKGDEGRVGPVGPEGKRGPKGDKGDKGDQGREGEKGERGDEGPRGEQGPTGPSGSGRTFFPRGGSSSSGSGLPAGGTPGQVVTNTGPGVGDWEDAAGGDIEAVLTQGGDPNGVPFTGGVLLEPAEASAQAIVATMQDDFEDVLYVPTGDTGDLTGNAYVVRIRDTVNNHHVFDLDAYGSMLFRGPFNSGAGTGGIEVYGGIFSAFTNGLVTFSGSHAGSVISIAGTFRASVNGGGLGFFDKENAPALQQTIDAPNATPEQIANILIAYGLAVQSP